MKTIRWLRRVGAGLGRLGSQLGYTLVEVTAVVGVTATLTALAVPVVMDKVNDGKFARAKTDLQGLGGAISSFMKDTGQFPYHVTFPATVPKGNCGSTKVAAGTASATGCFSLLVGPGADPKVNTTLSGKSVAGILATVSSPTALTTHVVNFDTIKGQLTDNTPKYSNFAGPYIQDLTPDPWGFKYFITTEGFNNIITTQSGTSSTSDGEKVWVMTAGPDSLLDTGSATSTLTGDDLGILIFGGLVKSK